jgi:hypothetical protein
MDQPVLRTLLDELARATEAQRIAHERFRAIMKDIPSGFPHPDGVQRAVNASTEAAHSRERLRAARARLEQFQTSGVIPKYLKDITPH